MPRKEEEPPSIKDMIDFLAGSLKKQANTPNMYGYKPHKKQSAFHTSAKKARLYIGGNRSGKSVGGVVEDLWWATGRHPYLSIPEPPIHGRIVGVDFINGVQGILLPIFKRWIVPSDLVGGSWERSWHNQERELHFSNGSVLDFKSSDQDLEKHAGTSRNFIHFDEEPPRSIFVENLMRLVDVGGSWWITMTPVEGMTWVYEDLYEPWFKGTRHDLDVTKVDMSDNPYLSVEEKMMVLGFLDDDERSKREHGTFVPKGGLVFPSFSQTVHCDLHGWRPPQDWLVYNSIDHGYNHPTADLWHAVSPDGTEIVTFHEMYGREKIVSKWAEDIIAWEREARIEPFLRTGDPSMKQRQAQSGASIQQIYAENGVYLALDSVPRDVSPGVNRMNQYLQINKKTGRPFWRISDCPNLAREMAQLHWDYFASGKMEDANNAKETIHKKNDHSPDSARYFFTFLPNLEDISKELLQDNSEMSSSTLPVGSIWEMLDNHTGQFVDSGDDWTVSSTFSVMPDSWEDDVA